MGVTSNETNRNAAVEEDCSPFSHLSYLPFRSGLAYRLSKQSRFGKLKRLLEVTGNNPDALILDVGAGGEWERMESTLERYYPYPNRIVALTMEKDISELQRSCPDSSWVIGNGISLPFKDKTFQVAFSNAVIEHLDGDHARRSLVGEMVRVASSAIVTTPNPLFPVEVHSRLPLVHWLPNWWHNRITKAFKIGYISKGPGEYFNPISPGMLRSYFPHPGEVQIRLGLLGMTLIAISGAK